MSSIGSYPVRQFNENQKFLVQDPSTSTASLVLGSDLVNYILPNLNSVLVETTRTAAQNTDYSVGTVVRTTGDTAVADGLGTTYLVVAGGTGDYTMLNGNDLLAIPVPTERRVIPYESLADVVASVDLLVGQRVSTAGYYTSGDGGANDYEIVAGGTGTADGGSFIDLDNGLQAKGLFGGGVNVKQFGAISDYDSGTNSGTVNNSFFQNCLDYCQSVVPALVLNIPSGDYYLDDVTSLLGTPEKDYLISGEGMGVSRLYWDNYVDATGKSLLVSNANSPTRPTCMLKDFSLIGRWGLEADFSEKKDLSGLSGFGKNIVKNVLFKGSRSGGLVGTNNVYVHVSDCIFEDCYRDSCRFENSVNATVANNRFTNIQDDAIALPMTDDWSGIENYHVVTGNTLVDSQGIATIGGKTVNISNNIIIRPMHRGILVGVGRGFETGNTAGLSITVANNTIIDGFDGLALSPLSGSGFRGIEMAGETFVAKDTVESGDPVVTPYPYFYTNNTDDSGQPNTGLWNIQIKGNNVVRTLDAVGAYSDYGFGTRLTRSGFVDPAIALSDLMLEGVYIDTGGNGCIVEGNTIAGCDESIKFEALQATNGVSYRNYVVSSNTIKNFRSDGVVIFGDGVFKIIGNQIDGDPFHENAERTANGGWTASFANNKGIDLATPSTVLSCEIQNNTFKNVGIPYTQGGAAAYDNSIFVRNTLIGDPFVTGHDANNKGIGFWPNVALLDASVIIEDSDPSSGTFKEVQNVCLTSSPSLPSSGKYATGVFVRNTDTSSSSYGWKRITTGSNHVLSTDWRAV